MHPKSDPVSTSIHAAPAGSQWAANRMAAWNEADPGCFIPSVMSQYTPFYKAAEHGIGRRITTYEYRRVVNYAMDLGLTAGYMQQKSSAREEYTPSFDLTGI